MDFLATFAASISSQTSVVPLDVGLLMAVLAGAVGGAAASIGIAKSMRLHETSAARRSVTANPKPVEPHSGSFIEAAPFKLKTPATTRTHRRAA